jgi:hypothetical protein
MAQEKITATQLLFPLSLTGFVLMVFLGFQTTLLVSDHDAMKLARAQQEQPLQQLSKLKAQVNALAVGTLKLSENGDKSAKNIIDQLKKAGVDVQDQAPAPAQAAPAMMAPAPAK